jgi:hypothetical protein
MKLVNLTPHPIVISGHDTIMPSGSIARVNTQLCNVGEVNGIPLMVSKNLGISNVPDAEADTMYVVASMVRLQLPARKDLCSPSKLIRNQHGGVVACGALEVNP